VQWYPLDCGRAQVVQASLRRQLGAVSHVYRKVYLGLKSVSCLSRAERGGADVVQDAVGTGVSWGETRGSDFTGSMAVMQVQVQFWRPLIVL
jgi:hypothetical protein